MNDLLRQCVQAEDVSEAKIKVVFSVAVSGASQIVQLSYNGIFVTFSIADAHCAERFLYVASKHTTAYSTSFLSVKNPDTVPISLFESSITRCRSLYLAEGVTEPPPTFITGLIAVLPKNNVITSSNP